MSYTILIPGVDTVNYPSRFNSWDRKMTIEDRWYRRYPSGRRYVRYLYKDLDVQLVNEMKNNVKIRYDNIVGIGGSEGTGKSNLAYHIARLYDPEFDMKKGYVYDALDFINAINNGEDLGKVFWMDEATNISNKRDWMKEENKLFIQILEMARSREWLLLMVIPDLDRLDVYLRDRRLRYQLRCMELGWENDPEVKRGYYELKKMPDYTVGKPKTIGYGRFPKMPPEIEKIYEEDFKNVAQKKKFEEIGEMFERKSGKTTTKELAKRNRKLLMILHDEHGYSYDDLERMTGLEYNTLRNQVSLGRKEAGKE